jgi:hypothetical protein
MGVRAPDRGLAMTDRYQHAPPCHAKPSAPGLLCTCGAGKLNAAFEAGKREGLEEAAKALEFSAADYYEKGSMVDMDGKELANEMREQAERIRALKDTK